MSLATTVRSIQEIVGAKADGLFGPETAGKILAALNKSSAVVKPDPSVGMDFDDRTERNLATTHPEAQDVFRPFLRRAIAIAASMGVEAKVICGLRDRAAQEQAFRSGASRAHYGSSWHNYGMAVDLGTFRGGRYLDADEPRLADTVYQAIGAVVGEYGIEWGGNWTSFKDGPHFQVDQGRSSPNSRDKLALGGGNWMPT